MQYLIEFIIVCGLAFVDFLTGFIKAKCAGNVSSRALRIGGMHKFAELVVMAAAIGLTVGFDLLGSYYSDSRLTDIAGAFTATGVFAYIVVMELISILENYAEIDPKAGRWIAAILKNLDKGE